MSKSIQDESEEMREAQTQFRAFLDSIIKLEDEIKDLRQQKASLQRRLVVIRNTPLPKNFKPGWTARQVEKEVAIDSQIRDLESAIFSKSIRLKKAEESFVRLYCPPSPQKIRTESA